MQEPGFHTSGEDYELAYTLGGEGLFLAYFSATQGRVFKQCATKGRFSTHKFVPERVWFFQSRKLGEGGLLLLSAVCIC